MVAGQFLRLFLVSVIATPPLFILGEITEELDRFVDLGLSGAEVARGYLFRMPEYIVWSFPIAGLVAAIFTVHTMTSHREIVAAKAGGISFHRLTLPIVLMGVLLTGAALALTELVPRSNRIAFQILRNEDPRRDWRSDFVYRSEYGLTLAARRLTMMDSTMTGILVQQAPTHDAPGLYLEAADASYRQETGWTFRFGFVRMMDEEGGEDAYKFDELRLPALVEPPEDLLDEPPEDEEMTYAELERAARIIERSGGNPHELRVKKEQRLAIPAATLVIILFGVPLATSSKRGGTAYGIGAALGTTILYVMLLKVAGAFGSSGAVPPWIVWTPNAFFLVASLVFLGRVRT
jgi:lipopolysaccharide export system permease protein